MYFQNQLCGMAMIIMLLYMFLRQKRIGLYSEWVFLRTLLLTMGSLFLDIFSLVAIEYRESIPKTALDIVCKTYLVSLIWVGYAAFTYIILDLYAEKEYRFRLRSITALTAAESVIVYILPIGYHVDEHSVYTEGWSVLLTYVFALSFVLGALCISLCCNGRIECKRRLATITWMGIWLVTAVIQFFNNELLLVGFASSLGMLALYCILENPENNIDHKFGCFRNHALASYLTQCYERGEEKSIIFLSFLHKHSENMTPEQNERYMKKLIEWFSRRPEAKIFNSIDGELAILFPNMSSMSVAFAQLQEEFYYMQFYDLEEDDYERREDFPGTLFVLFPDILLLKNTAEVMAVRESLHVDNHHRTKSLVCYVDEKILHQMRSKEKMVEEIIRALEEDRVEIFFQPIYAVRKKQFLSAEALVRIRNVDGSYLSPGAFIPTAEENGLIIQLGERVFEKVCMFLRDHNPEELGIDYIEVNLSVLQCELRNLSNRYIGIMKHYGTNPSYINLEITETGTFSAKSTLLRNMNSLIEKGVTFSLDDFGNGQSNLNYIIDMPVVVMKLDMNMTQAYFTDKKASVVVKSAIRLAHELELLVVAEGVETKEQLDAMVSLGVDYIQGYYFSKPLPIDEYLRFIDKQ